VCWGLIIAVTMIALFAATYQFFGWIGSVFVRHFTR
jgi:hypothetical protein